MTLNISQLQERVAAKFPEVELVNDTVLRFMKKLDGSPYAVYYLDLAQNLPLSKKALAKYQDQVIGQHYFEGRSSLQWNNYLYFITQSNQVLSDKVRTAKEIVERDRSYARKFVIPEEDLDSVLTPPVVTPAASTLHAHILNIWTELLTESGLDKAILSDKNLPDRLNQIELQHTAITAKPKKIKRSSDIAKEPFIRSFKLNAYWTYPRQRNFNFGTVNLISGANGSGKTLLLEAIELFYCGKNKRNPGAGHRYELEAVFADSKSKIVTEKRKPAMFRKQNHLWYGRPEIKTNNLYKSFAQFNFLNTDAAVSLADSVSRIDEDLANLLVGPDASKIWQDIIRVSESVVQKLRDLHLLEDHIKKNIISLDEHIKEYSGIRFESDSISVRLVEMINRIGWGVDKANQDKFEVNNVEALSELIAIAQQAAKLNWTESPVTINGMDEYCRVAKIVSEEVDGNLDRLDHLQKAQTKLANLIKLNSVALAHAKEAKHVIESGVVNSSEDRNKQRNSIARYSRVLSVVAADSHDVFSSTNLDMQLIVCHKEALVNLSSVKMSLSNTKLEYEKFCKQMDQALNLVQELRLIAATILEDSPKPNDCPLCHTKLKAGELTKRINVSGDSHLEATGKKLLAQIQEREIELTAAIALESVLKSLKEFFERANLSRNITVRSALTEVEDVKGKLQEAEDQLKSLDRKINMLESQGFTMVRMEELAGQLHDLGHPLASFSQEEIDCLIVSISESSTTLANELANESRTINELNEGSAEALFKIDEDEGTLKSMQSQLKEKIASTESLLQKLNYFFSSQFPWPGDRKIAELVIEAESIRKVAADLQNALDREKYAKDTSAESIETKNALQKQLAGLQLSLKRFTEAKVTLENIISKHSLQSAMDATLQENRESIESIFKNIHFPIEFSGLGNSLDTLVRKVDGSEAKLSEISTGQRAAFALSIFLAQNAQLEYAPPVILIDDPIAHVDDLNSLSFLDYLREIVLKGNRQIFFATADDKLATLFQRKFDFLGTDEFRMINLRRDS